MGLIKKKIFPQANDFKKILKLISLNDEDLKNNDKIMNELNIGLRQVNYYLSSLEYFDVVESRNFTDYGKKLKKLPYNIMIKSLIKLILSNEVFFDVFYEMHFLKKNVSATNIGDYIFFEGEVKSERVAYRRGSTVKSWVEWIIKHINP